MNQKSQLKVDYVPVRDLKPADYNPRKWSNEAIKGLKESITKFGLVDPIIVNNAPNRKGVVVGGHFRLKIAKDLGYKEVPVVFVNIPDPEKERELNIRLNKNLGTFDIDLLAKFDETFLSNTGFSSEELDEIFDIDIDPEIFDLQKELAKLDIKKVEFKHGDVYQLGENLLMCGDSTVEEDVLKLMNGKS